MRNFLRHQFNIACTKLADRISEGRSMYTPEQYAPDRGEGVILLHPPDSDPRCLLIWAAGKLSGIDVYPLHCSIGVQSKRGNLWYYDYTMDGVHVQMHEQWRDVADFIKFPVNEARQGLMIYRVQTMITLENKINLVRNAYQFFTVGYPTSMVCTSFINWLVFDDHQYLSPNDLKKKVHQHFYEQDIPETRTVS